MFPRTQILLNIFTGIKYMPFIASGKTPLNPLEILKSRFKHTAFQRDQEKIINRLLSGKDHHCLVLMPTGGGKSLCYQLTALCLPGKTLVISPLISLMKDQVDALRKKGIEASFINSTVSKGDREKRLEEFVYGKTKIFYVTPERFKKAEFMEKVKRVELSLLAVDEAHCISAWGNDFRPDFSRIGEYRKSLGNPLTIALTATATVDVQEDILRVLQLDESSVKTFNQGIQRPNLHLEAEEVVDDEMKLERMVGIIARIPGSGIIYFSLIKTLETFSALLDQLGITHLVYHGKLDQSQRKRVQNTFMKGSELVLATNAFGMGIDKKDIRFIVHAEIPGSLESYYQEIGRAGRDGQDSLCSLFYNQDDLMIHMDFIKWSNPEPSFYQKLFQFLEKEIEKANIFGLEYLREQLVYKNRYDFRLDTALGLLERHGVTSGSIDDKNLKLTASLPESLIDESVHEKHINHDRQKLLGIVNYFRTDSCRFSFLEEYFGITSAHRCRNCDNC
jgi:ATP-dependent DNA helicase RecQ